LEDNQDSGVSEKLATLVEDLKKGSSKSVLELFQRMQDQKKAEQEVDEANVVKGSRKRKKAAKVNVQPEAKKASKSSASKSDPRRLGARVQAETSIFGQAYTQDNPGTITGTVVSRESAGVVRVLWDEDRDQGEVASLRSHWKHLKVVDQEVVTNMQLFYMMKCTIGQPTRFEKKVYHMFMTIEKSLLRREMYESNKTDLQYPKSFWECLVLDDWREWVKAIMSEMSGWEENSVMTEVKIEDVAEGAPIISLEELYLIKRSGKYKQRLYARGDQMKPGDYLDTKAHTVSAETMRFCFSLATSCQSTCQSENMDIFHDIFFPMSMLFLCKISPKFVEISRTFLVVF